MSEKLWRSEPDRVVFEVEGYHCEVRRMKCGGHLCGYVRLPESHPWRLLDGTSGDFGEVHGGISFQEEAIEAEGWLEAGYYVGFDCAHASDMCPDNPNPFETYREIGYVIRECTSLARQAARAAEGGAIEDVRAKAVRLLGEDAVRILERYAEKAARAR